MKPDDALLRLKNLPIKPSHSHVQIEQRDFWYLISAIETLTAEKAKLVDALEDIRKGPWNGCSGCNRMEMAHEALASVGTEAE